MNKIVFSLLVFICVGLSGCYQFVAEHPEKSEQEFYEDQALCEKEARKYALERREQVSDVDEINHTRRCMRGLGWEYHFRKSSASSDTEKDDSDSPKDE